MKKLQPPVASFRLRPEGNTESTKNSSIDKEWYRGKNLIRLIKIKGVDLYSCLAYSLPRAVGSHKLVKLTLMAPICALAR